MDASFSIVDPSATAELLSAAAQGDEAALDRLLACHRDYVRRLVDMRLDADLRARIDPSDVVQETFLGVSHKLPAFANRRHTTFRLWLRSEALQRLIDARRRHFSAKRDARRELTFNDCSSLAILGAVAGGPSENLRRRELIDQVREALAALSGLDREVLLLRQGELLSNLETAEVLGIEPDAASKRYGRAALRLASELRRRGLYSRQRGSGLP